MRLIFMWLISCTAFLWIAEAHALPGSTMVKELNSGVSTNLTLLVKEFNFLAAGRHSSRRNFESLGDFEDRIRGNTLAFLNFLSLKYEIVTPPDSVALDWQNSTVRIALNFPVVVRRERGGGKDSTHLTISANVEPKTARIINTFPQQLIARLYFRFLQDGSLLVDNLVLQINGRSFHRE